MSSASLTEGLSRIRPRLHRYCARLVGSAIDGEDAVQDALARAVEAFDPAAPPDNLEGWVFRIAHNSAMDLLRRRARAERLAASRELDDMIGNHPDTAARVAAATALRTFMRLPAGPRSAVILMDVLGYSLEEIAATTDASVAAVKASLHRGRQRLRELRSVPEQPFPPLDEATVARLGHYVDRFNARDFAAVRALLAEDVALEVVGRATLRGRAQVSGQYFTNYALAHDWTFAPGLVEGKPALIALDPERPGGPPLYFVLTEWAGPHLKRARDFRHASYAIEGADVELL